MQGSLREIAISDLGDTVGTPPSQRLKDNVKRMGVLQPIMLSRQADEAGEIHLSVIDGNRRVGAARAAGLESIPAIVFEDLHPNTVAETTLATNHFRSSNYLAEFWALKHLERNSYGYEDMVAASGMARSSLELRSTLSSLNRELFVALRNGQISQTDATATAKLPAHLQDEIAERFRRRGKLTRKDIQEIAPSTKPETTPGDAIADQLADAASKAHKLGYNRAEFLEMAAQKWDEVIGELATPYT